MSEGSDETQLINDRLAFLSPAVLKTTREVMTAEAEADFRDRY